MKKIAITGNSYINVMKKEILKIILLVIGITFIIISMLVIMWSNSLVSRIKRLKEKVNNINNDDYDHKIASFLYGVVNEWLFLMASCVRMYQKKEKLLKYFGNTSVEKSIRLKSAIGRVFHSRKNPRIWYERCERWSKRIHRPHSGYVAVSAGRGHYFGERYRREELLPAADTLFEGHPVKTARNADYFLRTLFGPDYMQEARQEVRERHGYTAVDLGQGETHSV